MNICNTQYHSEYASMCQCVIAKLNAVKPLAAKRDEVDKPIKALDGELTRHLLLATADDKEVTE